MTTTETEKKVIDFIMSALITSSYTLPAGLSRDVVEAAITCFEYLLRGDTEAAFLERQRFYEANGWHV